MISNKRRFIVCSSLFIFLSVVHGFTQNNSFTIDDLKKQVILSIESQYETNKEVALQVWDFAELGYKEYKSSELLKTFLRENEFVIESGLAGMPTSFIATYGNGEPVIGILAEYDALPGISQSASPTKTSVANKDNGHGCGHHLFGTASITAGIAIKNLIKNKNLKGTIRVYGTPAEEGGSGKVYMVREGLFNDVDVVMHWHPSDFNSIRTISSLANKTAKFRFKGIASHAAASPENGRSALDGVESMNYMVNMMREHIPEDSRIHYVITAGGKAPNVVPAFAEVYYYVRHFDKEVVQSLFERLVKAAEGAALGTETKMEYEVISGVHDLLINKTLASTMLENLKIVGGVKYTKEEEIFAKKIQSSFEGTKPNLDIASKIQPWPEGINIGSTDVGDVSYAVPTVGLMAATWVPGTRAHSWQAVACGGMDIGIKGMQVAAKTMALTAIDLFLNPELIKTAKKEHETALGNYKYKALLGNRNPPLDYRN